MTTTFDPAQTSSHITLSGGNLVATANGIGYKVSTRGTVSVDVDEEKYWRATITAVGTATHIGFVTTLPANGNALGAVVSAWGYQSDGTVLNNGGSVATFAAFTTGDTIGAGYNRTTSTLSFYKNGAHQGDISSVTGALYPAATVDTGGVVLANFSVTVAGFDSFDSQLPTPGNAAGTLQVITGYGARLAAGTGTLQPIGGSGGRNGAGAGILAPFQVSATGGHNGGAGTLSSLTASATGRQAHYGIGVLEEMTASGTGTDSSIITIARSAPAPTLSATLLSGTVITVTANAPAPILTATLDSGRIITVAISAPAPTLSARILTGNVATILASAATPILLAAGYPAYTITFAGTLPAPRLNATLSAAVASAYRTWVVNLRKGALTEYGSEWAMNSYAVFNGVVLGCTSSGIVTLGTQSLDNATAIAATVTSGKDNFGTSKIKRIPRIYIDYATDGNAQFSLTTTEGGARTYALNWNSVAGVQQRRVPVGKGPKSSRWQWSYANVSGADFDLNAVLAYPIATRRRVQ